MKIYYVDLPNPKRTSEDDSWINMKVYKTKRSALRYLNKLWGIPAKLAEVFIMEGEIN